MISFLFSLSPFILIFYYLYLLRKDKSIGYEIKRGVRCYSCKEEIDYPEMEKLEKMLETKHTLVLCKSCQRDIKINSIMNFRKSILYKIDKFILSEKYEKYYLFLFFIPVLLVVFQAILLYFFKIKMSSTVINISNIALWILILRRHKLTSIKKDKNSEEDKSKWWI